MFTHALCALLLATTCLSGARAEDEAFEATRIAKLVAADARADDRFGYSVSVSGSTIVVGAYEDDDHGINSGSAYVFEKSDDGEVTQAAKLVASDGYKTDYFGWSVSVSGSTIVVGSKWDEDTDNQWYDSGSAYVFEKSDDGEWAQAAKLVAADAAEKDQFGWSVSVSGSTIVVGANQDDDNAPDSGAAYVFEKGDDGIWAQSAKLVAVDGDQSDQFGYTVSVSDSTIVVGAVNDDDKAINSGAVYVFEKSDTGEWNKAAKLVASDGYKTDYIKLVAADGAKSDHFGYSVSVSDCTIVVGAYQWYDSGSAYVFEKSNGAWAQAAKLVAADAAEKDRFGWSVSVSGSTIVVGAWADDDGGSNSGSAYVFEKSDDGAWAQAAKLVADDAAAGDNFGWSVSVSGSAIVVGAHLDDDKTGSAYVFESNRDFTTSDDSDVDDSDVDGASPASVSATFHNVLDDIEFETTVTKTSDGTYNVTAEQENATTSGAFLGAELGAAAAAVAAMSSPARAAAPVLALAAVAAAAGVAMNKSRRASRTSDEDAPLLKGAQYGAASV